MSTYPFPYSQAAKLDSRIKIPRPVYDPALAPLLDSASLPEEFDLDLMRGVAKGDQHCSHGTFIFNAETVLRDHPHLMHTEHTIPGPEDTSVILSVFAPKELKELATRALPVLYHIHGGGMVSGDRFTALTQVIDLLKDIDCIVVSVEHRLAPETQAPGPAEDCYAGLVWVSENAETLGIDPAAIVSSVFLEAAPSQRQHVSWLEIGSLLPYPSKLRCCTRPFWMTDASLCQTSSLNTAIRPPRDGSGASGGSFSERNADPSW